MAKAICEDINGNLIRKGDLVKTYDGTIHRIHYRKYRDEYGSGRIYGYYVPDGAELLTPAEEREYITAEMRKATDAIKLDF